VKDAIHFVGRLTVAFLMIAVLAVVIFLFTIIALIVSGKHHAGPMAMAALVIFQTVVASAPAVFVASLTSGDTKKTRLCAATKSIFVVSAICILWNYSIGPWVGTNIFGGSSMSRQMAFALDGFVETVLMFLSGILAARWLPSLKPSAVGAAPKSVKNFERLMFVYLGLLLVSAVLNYDYAVEQISSATSKTIIGGMMGGPFVIATFASSFLLIFYVTVSVSRAGSKAMRAVMLGTYLIGVVLSVPRVSNMNYENKLPLILYFVLLLIEGYACYLLFTPESNKWFAGDK
jgi:hypothetical protein